MIVFRITLPLAALLICSSFYSLPLRAQTTANHTDRIDIVRLRHSWVNAKNLKIVELTGRNGDYTLACEEGFIACFTPSLKTSYEIVKIKAHLYECENVILAPLDEHHHDQPYGHYCLMDTTSAKNR